MSSAPAEFLVAGLVQSTVLFWLSGIFLARLGRNVPVARDFPWTSFFGVPLALGLLLRYAVELFAGKSLYADGVCLVAAAAGILPAIRAFPQFWPGKSILCWLKRLLFPLLWLPLALLSIMAPVITGDAKEIWFFHGKMIFFAQGISSLTGFDDPVIGFSHADYPKLVATIAATIANMAGSWNDHLPKFSVALVQAPVFTLFADLIAGRGFILGLVMLVSATTGAGVLLYNGYMDGMLGVWLVALMSAMWLLGVSRNQASNDAGEGRDNIDIAASIAVIAVAMLVGLKNEGVPLALVFVPVSLWALSPRIQDRGFKHWINGYSRVGVVVPAMLGALGFVAWRIQGKRWGLVNDMSGDMPAMWSRLERRIGDPQAWLLCNLHFETWFAPWWLVLTAAVVAWSLLKSGKALPANRLVAGCFAGATVYSVFLVFIYLGTHHEVDWHLHYSSSRTFLPAQSLLMLGFGFAVIRLVSGIIDPSARTAIIKSTAAGTYQPVESPINSKLVRSFSAKLDWVTRE
jgi:hypothetical protein